MPNLAASSRNCLDPIDNGNDEREETFGPNDQNFRNAAKQHTVRTLRSEHSFQMIPNPSIEFDLHFSITLQIVLKLSDSRSERPKTLINTI